jgi:type II secretory pathway predicted ATPase ExeA
MKDEITELRFDTIPPREEWKYDIYGLPYNPFQVAGLAERVPTLPIYRLDVAKDIRDYVSSTYKKQEYGGLLVRGEYGMGKSHLLRYITHEINTQLGTRGSDRAIAIYAENPETSMENLISRLIEALERKTLEQLAWNIVARRAREIGSQGVLERTPSDLFASAARVQRLQDMITKHLLSREWFLGEWTSLFYGDRDYQPLREIAQEELSRIFQHPDMVDVFCDLLLGDEFTSYRAHRSLVQLRGRTKFTTAVRPERLFGEILELFRRNGYGEVYILIDEFEDIRMKLSKAKMTQYLSEFRSLIDNNIKYCAFVIAIVPSAWDVLEGVQPALAERFSRRVDLLPLSDQQVEAVLEGYLKRALLDVDPDAASVIEATSVFDTEAILEINQIQEGNLRGIVELCHRLIEEGVDQNMKPITAEFVQTVARSSGD